MKWRAGCRTWGVLGIWAVFALNVAMVYGQGDTCEDCIPIPELPFTASGDSCPFEDQYDAICPYGGSISPDVVYCYHTDVDQTIDIELCTSGYDTKVFVFRDVCMSGLDVACNDDACGVDGYRSELLSVELQAGFTYYIVVDGYGGQCGEYTLDVRPSSDCFIAYCPPGWSREGEPACSDDYLDTYNAGCGSEGVPGFGSISCGENICAEGGTFVRDGSNMRDTDWYTFYLDETSDVMLTVLAEFPILAGFLAPGDEEPCAFEILTLQNEEPCVVLVIRLTGLEPGMYWAWAGASEFEGWPCGGDYHIQLACEPSIGACCFTDFSCEQFSEVDCAAAGGSWLGPETACEECPCYQQVLGDTNCDGVINTFDIDPFILALTRGEDGWNQGYGGVGCDFLCVCDVNRDGAVNNFDIDPIIELFMGK